MAKIVEEVIIIKLSRVVKDGGKSPAAVANQEILSTLESVAQELVGDGVVVEAVIGV